MVNPTFKITPLSEPLPQYELSLRLYMHYTHDNQRKVLDKNLPNSFGSITVHDWPLYDRRGSNAKLIARARGVHILAGMSNVFAHNAFSISFEDARFDMGSTLEVMGPFVSAGEWAIVGGTGKFTMAQGVIYKKNLEHTSHGNIVELDIHAFYTPSTVNGQRLFGG